MSLPRPKILTELTVPTGGWVLDLYITDAVQFDTKVQVTIAAGTYFVSWDQQADDYLGALQRACYTALDASAVAAYNGANEGGKPCFAINSAGKVLIEVIGEEMRIDWTAEDGASIAAVLGFDSSAVLDMVADTQYTGTWQHAYGWYAADDNYIKMDMPDDVPITRSLQSVVPSGQVSTQFVAERYRNELALQFVPRNRMWSNGVGYTTTPTKGYEKNQGLECWWHQAAQGKRFRYYRDSVIDTAKAEITGTATGGTTTTLTDSGRSWDTDPQEHEGKLLVLSFTGSGQQMRWHIDSHTATVLTVADDVHNVAVNFGGNGYYIFNQPYRTYVVDIQRMSEFAPRELPQLDKYDIRIPMLRYQA